MIEILNKRPPEDDFTFDLWQELLHTIERPFSSYYMCYDAKQIKKMLIDSSLIDNPNIILAIKDHMEPDGQELLTKLANQYHATNFVVLTSMENFPGPGVIPNNLQTVCWGGDITNQLAAYNDLQPVLDKNFGSTKNFLALNRGSRQHRIFLLTYLYILGIQSHGHLSLLQPQNPGGAYNWDQLFELPRQSTIKQQFFATHDQVINDRSLQNFPLSLVYPTFNDNVSNFNNNLRDLYRNSFVEIVSETTFSLLPYLVTEKTRNAFLGCNFPIILSGRCHVQHLRDLGLDLFDDIINHDYDRCWNPVDRIIMAITLNQGLLTDLQGIKNAWKSCQQRFQNNVEVFKTLGHHYRNRALTQWSKLHWQ